MTGCRPTPEVLTNHAEQRVKHRGIPENVLKLLQDGRGYIVPMADGAHFHVIRTGKNEAVWGVERNGGLITIIKGTFTRFKNVAANRSNNLAAVQFLNKLPVLSGHPPKDSVRYFLSKKESAERKKEKILKKVNSGRSFLQERREAEAKEPDPRFPIILKEKKERGKTGFVTHTMHWIGNDGHRHQKLYKLDDVKFRIRKMQMLGYTVEVQKYEREE